jgi:rhodanese-related sulfurtransferase
MKLRWTWMILLMLALAAFWGCSDDDDGPADPPTAATPFETLAAAGAVYVNDSTDCPGVLAADVLQANLEDYTVIDIRSEADYLAGHIPGAFHSTLQTLVADLPNIPTGKPYVVTCYSGQSAGFAKFAMEMLGYEDVKSLKFGMSSWSSALATGTWNNPTNVGNHLATPETTNNNADLVAHTVPDLGTYTNSTVVSARVGELLAGGFKSKTWAAVQDNLDDYFILNYWNEPDYSTLGHIPGAYQFTPYTSLGIDQMLDTLPTDMPILVYCWTGQHSSQVTAYLRCLGYDAWSFQYGANCLMHDALPASNQWTAASTHDYSVQPGWEPTADFAALAEAGIAYINDTTDFAGIISAQALYDNLADYTVIDVRSATDYAAGHIAGAYNSTIAALLTNVGTTIPTTKPFVVACYSGQSAGFAKFALEMMGYEDTKSLGFGMSSWNSTLSATTWNNPTNIANNLTNPETTNNNAGLTWHQYPATTGDVATRVQAVLTGGFKSKKYVDIRDNLGDYFFLNYHEIAHYEGTGTFGVPGHIPGAFQFTPGQSLGLNQMLGNLPTDKPIIVYCWTGQQSSQLTAYLIMLGYEAYSLSYGANNLYYDSLTNLGVKWEATDQRDFPLVPSTVLAAR